MGMSSRLLSRFLLRVATARDKCTLQCCFDRKGVRQPRAAEKQFEV